MDTAYDVFISYTWADRHLVELLARTLRDQELQVFIDDPEIDDFSRITTRITTALAASKALLAYYSAAYPTRRACQWELTAAYLAAQRDGDPAKRILVVNPEPTADHLHPGELRDAIFSRLPEDSTGMDELAKAVARHVHGLSGTLGEVAPLRPSPWLPTQGLGSTRFVGRLSYMWEIHSALHPETTKLTVGRTGPTIAQIRGLGGIGKSLLAEEYALRFGAAYPGGVFWMSAFGSHEEGTPAIAELIAEKDRQVRMIAARLGIRVGGLSPDEIQGALSLELHRRDQPFLWIIDDVPAKLDVRAVKSIILSHPLAHILLTTRSREYGALATSVDLDVLSAEDGYALLTARRDPVDTSEESAASEIVSYLGGHALAIDVAGAALRNQQGIVSFADFVAWLQHPDRDALELASQLSDALPSHEASIVRTLSRSIHKLSEAGRDFLRLTALVAALPVPAQVIYAVFDELDEGNEDEPSRAILAINEVESLSLASKVGGHAWLVHALVTRMVRLQEPNPERLVTVRTAVVAALNSAMKAINSQSETKVRMIVPHARELVREPRDYSEAVLLGRVALYDFMHGEYRSALLLYRRMEEVLARLLGNEHLSVLRARRSVGRVLHAKGDYVGARRVEEEVLSAYVRLLGDEHPDTLVVKNNLALTLHALGDLRGAMRLQRESLDARRRVLGNDHPETLNARGNLAEIARDHGDLIGAMRLQKHVLEVRRRVLGREHPDTLTAMANLAGTLRAKGDSTEAYQLEQEVFVARRHVLGEDHRETLTAKLNLAAALTDRGALSDARSLLMEALDSLEQLLGDEHPDVLTAKGNLAAIIDEQGDRARAGELLEEVLDARRRLLGEDHPDTLSSMVSLGIVLARRNPGYSRDLLEGAFRGRRRVLGDKHPDTISAWSDLYGVLCLQNDLESAYLLAQEMDDDVLTDDPNIEEDWDESDEGSYRWRSRIRDELADEIEEGDGITQLMETRRRLLDP